jgi:hypothetical protein
MDPYLEGSEWMSFHLQFTAEIARQLAPQLRPRYVALTTKYFITDSNDNLGISAQNGKSQSIYADVGVVERAPWVQPKGGAQVAVMEPSLHIATVMPELVPQHVVEIRDVDERRLVTLIEVLSPANKRGSGYDEYIAKRQRILLSTAHLLEIDLLRKGKRIPLRKTLPAFPYFIFLSRYPKRPIMEIWAIKLAQRLPMAPVPLLPDDQDVVLDLQLAFTNVYDAIGYDLLLDYTQPPDVPLEDEAATWAASLLQTHQR